MHTTDALWERFSLSHRDLFYDCQVVNVTYAKPIIMRLVQWVWAQWSRQRSDPSVFFSWQAIRCSPIVQSPIPHNTSKWFGAQTPTPFAPSRYCCGSFRFCAGPHVILPQGRITAARHCYRPSPVFGPPSFILISYALLANISLRFLGYYLWCFINPSNDKQK